MSGPLRILVLALGALLASACTTRHPAPPVAATAQVALSGAQPAVTHGNDPLPPRPAALAAQAPMEAGWPCEGTGEDGRRVQLLYLHPAGSADVATMRPSIEAWARQVEGIVLTSARETGGERLLRFATGPGCALSILDAVPMGGALDSFDAMIDELRTAGLTRDDRIYHAVADSSAYCGIGTVYTDDQPGPGNANNALAQYSRSDRPCWGPETMAHELTHNLGGVQNSAPNSTGGLHCRDEHDVMCYADGAPRGQMVTVCPDAIGEDRFDCRHDDYFSTAPAGYLADHWNVADSAALDRSASPTTIPPPTTVPPPTSTTSLPPTTSTTVGKGETTTAFSIPASIHAGEPFQMLAHVGGSCGPTGTIAFYVSGRLMSRQVVDPDGYASVTVIVAAPSRPTFRADYSGNERCAASRDTYRKRVS